ncbi:serine/threonine-protein kinase [Arthrobacter tumbae]|uniref:serine/threonine-protein kinase n=1 Tax=Arthrobacter tumbae TaxID=163874 RepID=UPI0019566972|nr:serine/threonine-protein kinase [Arthrobacter tumbae]MBM7780579.1 serine/threonine protein kinase [Arthrobacter tumbae]
MDSKGAGSAHAATTVGEPDSQPDLGLPQILGGRYRLDALLGQGGMASVHKARDEVLDRDVAVKVFHTGSIKPEDEARQRAEAQILAGLNHRNLVTVFDIGTDTSDLHHRTFLVMELITGQDLHRTHFHAPLSAEETKAMGRGVAQALAYIHSQRVIHRDVKPANILLGTSGNPHRAENPKLTDFGIARLVEEAHLTATGQSVGTAAYFSPEQAEGLAATAASDIYSLGLVLLECLTGETPFPGPAAASAAARLHRDPVIPASPDSDWGRLLRDMTHRNPAARPSAEDVARALSAPSMTAGGTAGIKKDSTAASQPPTEPQEHIPHRPDPQPTTAQQPLQNWRGAALQTPNDDGGKEGDDEWPVNAHSTEPAAPQRRRKPRALRWALIALAAALTLLIAVVILVPVLMSGTDSETVNYPPAPGELGVLLEELQESVTP